MGQLEMGTQSSRRRIVGKAGIILLIAVIALTFLSRTIEGFLMPKVTVTNFVKGSLQNKFDTEGTVELLDKGVILAGGAWKVKKVYVSMGQTVKKGDLLAEIDNNDILIDIKRMDLELIKLEDDLESFRSTYEASVLPACERDVELAERNMGDAEKNLSEIKALYESVVETKSNLEKAEREYDDRSYDYDVKQKALKAKRDEYNRGVGEKNAELELKRMEYEKYKRDIPSDGKIISGFDGNISAVDIEEGGTTASGQAMLKITAAGCPYRVFWYMDPEKAREYGIGSQISFSVTGKTEETSENKEGTDIKTVTIKAQIVGKEFIINSDSFKLWVDITADQAKSTHISVSEGQKADICAEINSKTYDNIIPKSCIAQIQGKDYIFVVKEMKSALGMVKYVEQTEVKVAGNDELFAAVDGYFDNESQVVANSTKSLSDGIRVRVR